MKGSSPIFLTQPIENEAIFGEAGFVDKRYKEIKEVEGELEVLINSSGGDIFLAAQLFRAILEHPAKTKALVVGHAASASALMLASFDYVEADIEARIMLHQAHVPDIDDSELDESDRNEIKVFNEKAKKLLIEKGKSNGVNNVMLLNRIFSSKDKKDFWFSAKEAKEILGIVDTVTSVKRENNNPVVTSIAASISDAKQSFNNYTLTKMGLFSKKNEKPIVARVAKLKDGRSIVFTSSSEQLAKGDKIALVGSNESLEGDLVLEDNTKLTINAENEVQAAEVAEQPKAQTPEELVAMIEEVKAMVDGLATRVTTLEESMNGGTAEAKKEVEALKDGVEKLINSLGDKKLITDFKVPTFEGKGEKVLEGVSQKTKHIENLREVLKRQPEKQ